MPRILMTGAAGGIGTSLRKLLPPIYPDLLLSDLKAPADLGKDEKFKAADLADLAQVEAICEGVDGILHFGGYSVEGPWDQILQSNIIGCYNLFEAARQEGRQARGVRLVEPRGRLLPAPSPDRHRRHRAAGQPLWRQQGVRRGGRRALCRQARARRDLPADRQFRRHAARPPPAVDLAEAGGPGAALPHRARSSRHPFRDLLRRLLQRARLVGQPPRLRPRLPPDRPRRGFPRARDGRAGQAASRTRSATSSRAARSAAWSSTATRAGSWIGASASAWLHPPRYGRDNPTC